MLAASWYTEQVLFNGAVQGVVYGLLAVAVILVYRSTRVINFAAGNMGSVASALFALMVVHYELAFWPSLAVSLLVGVLFGAAVELIVVRRLIDAPRVVLLVATIGVAHPKWDERPLLLVVKRKGARLTKKQMLTYFDGKVASWWIPDDVVFVDELPHTATGKLLKTQLREDFKDHKLPEG